MYDASNNHGTILNQPAKIIQSSNVESDEDDALLTQALQQQEQSKIEINKSPPTKKVLL